MSRKCCLVISQMLIIERLTPRQLGFELSPSLFPHPLFSVHISGTEFREQGPKQLRSQTASHRSLLASQHSRTKSYFPNYVRNGGMNVKLVVLLVKDDMFQREVLADLLKDEGFEVIECTTAEAAELIIASTGSELLAVVTDHNLAGAMSGAALASYAGRRHPGMTIVIMSEQP